MAFPTSTRAQVEALQEQPMTDRLQLIRDAVVRDGANLEDAYADRAWLLHELDAARLCLSESVDKEAMRLRHERERIEDIETRDRMLEKAEAYAAAAFRAIGKAGCDLYDALNGAKSTDEVLKLVRAAQAKLDALPEYEIGTGWIEHTDSDGKVKREPTTAEGAKFLRQAEEGHAVGNAVLSPVLGDAAQGLLDGRVGEHWHDFRWAAARREQIAFVEGAQLAQRTTGISGDGWMKEEASRRYILPLSVKPFLPQTIPSQCNPQEADRG